MSFATHYFYSACQRVTERIYGTNNTSGDILMFHQVADQRSTWKDTNCSITEASFKLLINDLRKYKRFGRINDLYKSSSKEIIFITFDDVYRDAIENAIPLLVEYKIPFTLFLTVDFIGKDGYISFSDIHTLANLPQCTFGAHTISHPMLRYIGDAEAVNEITNSGKELSKLLEKPIDIFAYPFGSYFACSRKNIFQAKSAGYKMAFSTLNCSLNPSSMANRWFLPRRNVNEFNYRKFMKE